MISPVSKISTQEFALQCGLIAVVVAACAIPFSGNNADADLWGHVQYGRDALAFGLPDTTTYSFTAVGYCWINHEILAELTMAVVDGLGGAQALLAMKWLLGMAFAAVLLRRQLQQGVSLLTASGLTLLVALNLNMFWHVRPQLFSYIFYTLLLMLLEFCFSGWSGRWWLSANKADDSIERIDYRSFNMRFLWATPILIGLWTNTHGAFAAGLAIYLAYLGCRAIEAWIQWRGESWGVLRRLTMMGCAAGLATFLNPYGPRLHLWLLESLGQPRPEITEWHPPNLLSAEWAPLTALIVVFFFAVACTRKSRDFTHLMILAATLWQTGMHLRHAPFFAIAFAYWMAPHLDSAIRRIYDPAAQPEKSPELEPGWMIPSAMALGAIVLGSVIVYRTTEMTVRRDEYPVSAVQFMHEHRLKGRTIVTYNWAQYLLGCFGERNLEGRDQGTRLAFDGRFRTCYPQEVIDMHFDFILGDNPPLRHRGVDSPPLKPDAVLDHGEAELAVISRYQPHSELTLLRRDDWVLLYQDELAQVWGRADVFDDPNSRRYLPPHERRITDQQQLGSVNWPALPRDREASADRRSS